MKILFVIIAFPIILAIIIGLPFIYNYHFHSLSKFSNSINIGDLETDVKEKIVNYCQKYKSDKELQCNINGPSLGIYQSSIFEIVQTTIVIKNQKVLNVQYIGD